MSVVHRYIKSDVMDFGNRLKAELKKSGKSQNWLSQKSGIAQSTISGYIKGTVIPTLVSAVKISEVLKVPLCYLVYGNHTCKTDVQEHYNTKPLTDYTDKDLLQELLKRQ